MADTRGTSRLHNVSTVRSFSASGTSLLPLTFFSSPVGTPVCFTLSAAHDDAASALPTLANPAMHWRMVTIVFGGRLDSFSVVYASR
jgi:hypothetical protein